MRDRLQWVRWPLYGSAGLLAVAVVAGAALAGPVGAAAAVAGVLVVVASYLGSGVAIAWADRIDPRLILPVGLVAYVVKFSLLGVVLFGVAASGWDGVAPMAVAMIAATLVWIVAQVWWTWRARLPYVETGQQ